MNREIAFIGFGSNLGNRMDFCDRALTLLSLMPHSRMTGASSLYETEPVADVCHPGSAWFLNGVVRIETDLTPGSLLEVSQEIERALGREEKKRDGPRTMDLDILFYGTHILNDPTLTLPHPRLHLRRFVLTPLVELAPDWPHPGLARPLWELLHELNDPSQVRRLDPQPSARYGALPPCTSTSTKV